MLTLRMLLQREGACQSLGDSGLNDGGTRVNQPRTFPQLINGRVCRLGPNIKEDADWLHIVSDRIKFEGKDSTCLQD
jgi:hypothetical protein